LSRRSFDEGGNEVKTDLSRHSFSDGGSLFSFLHSFLRTFTRLWRGLPAVYQPFTSIRLDGWQAGRTTNWRNEPISNLPKTAKLRQKQGNRGILRM